MLGAASLPNVGILFPADPAGIVIMGVTPLTDAGAASLADPLLVVMPAM